jgi:diguanylate cyclase (GGDEF)-like protein
VLRLFGDLMKRHARSTDIYCRYCRYGSEEFLLVLPGMKKDGAAERAEQLRKEMAAIRVTNCGPTPFVVTASFGVASFPQNGRTGDEVVAAADRALYAAKSAGCNRVRLNRETVKAGDESGPPLDRSPLSRGQDETSTLFQS